MNSLIGKWILMDRGEHYLIGHITDVNGDYIMIQMKPKTGSPDFYHLYHIGELSCDCRECINSYFFDTEEQLTTWAAWIDKPDENNIVLLDKKAAPPWEKKH